MSDHTNPIDLLAQKLHVLGLAPIVALILEAHRPLAFVTGQLCYLAVPLVGIWDQRNRAFVAALGRSLSEDQEAVDRLLVLLTTGVA